ncbi:MAG: hypothetical protein Q9159_001769 [Coniocarpon cinnabarinum]
MARKTAEQKRKQQAQNAAAAKIPGTAQYCAHKEHKAQKAASKHAASAPLPSEAGPSTFATATNSASGPASTLSSPSSQSPWASSNSSIQSSDAATVSTGSSAEAASLPTPPPSTPSPVRRPRTIWIPDVLDDHPEYGRLSPQYVDNFAHNAGAIREMVAPAPQEKTSRKGFAKAQDEEGIDALWAIVAGRVLSYEPASLAIKEALLGTGESELVFLTNNKHWLHWGVRCNRKGLLLSRREREESNCYGQVMMRVRDELKKEEWAEWIRERRTVNRHF